MGVSMGIYKISCPSKCGTYSVTYLQSITVVAESELHAKQLVRGWLDENCRSFLYDESEWRVELLTADFQCIVVGWFEDSDY